MARPIVLKAKLTGAKELERALRELPKRIGKAAVRRAMLKSLKPVAAAAEATVRASSFRTGGLASSITVSTRLSRRQRKAGMKGDDIAAYVGASPSRVAHLVEFGTGPRETKAGRSTGSMPAEPFLRPAWDAHKAGVLKEFGRLLGIEIDKAAARLARRQAKSG